MKLEYYIDKEHNAYKAETKLEKTLLNEVAEQGIKIKKALGYIYSIRILDDEEINEGIYYDMEKIKSKLISILKG